MCQLKPKENESTENSAAKLDAEEKLRKAREIIEKKKKEKEAEDARVLMVYLICEKSTIVILFCFSWPRNVSCKEDELDKIFNLLKTDKRN